MNEGPNHCMVGAPVRPCSEQAPPLGARPGNSIFVEHIVTFRHNRKLSGARPDYLRDTSVPAQGGKAMLNRIIRYFDLQSAQRTAAPVGYKAGAKTAPVLPQYIAVSAGVVIEPLLRGYIESGIWGFDFETFWGRLVFGLIIGVVILPGIYKSTFDPKQPILIQLAALFPLGIGWQSLFTSATRAVAG